MSSADWLSQGTLVLASNNKGKIAEFEKMFAELNLPVDVVPQGQLNIEDAVEDGLSFVENAILKARHAAKISGKPAIADDSGICVPLLAWSRLRLARHSWVEVLGGSVLELAGVEGLAPVPLHRRRLPDTGHEHPHPNARCRCQQCNPCGPLAWQLCALCQRGAR